jgi:hypothetical protein
MCTEATTAERGDRGVDAAEHRKRVGEVPPKPEDRAVEQLELFLETLVKGGRIGDGGPEPERGGDLSPALSMMWG